MEIRQTSCVFVETIHNCLTIKLKDYMIKTKLKNPISCLEEEIPLRFVHRVNYLSLDKYIYIYMGSTLREIILILCFFNLTMNNKIYHSFLHCSKFSHHCHPSTIIVVIDAIITSPLLTLRSEKTGWTFCADSF